MFSKANFPGANVQNGVCKENEPSKEEVAKESLEKLQRMVLGKDDDINSEYVKSFYVDIANEVGSTFFLIIIIM